MNPVRSFLALCLLLSLLGLPALADDEPRPPRRRLPRRQALPAGVRVERDLVYATVGDKTLRLDLYMPSAAANARPPLIVWIHGGGWRAGSKERCRLTWIVPEGFAVASIEYRLSHEAVFPAQIHDCKGAVRWLRAHAARYGYDGTRVGVAGSSAGGHLAALVGTSGGVKELEGAVGGHPGQSSRVQAVYDMYGPSDFLTMHEGRHGRRDPFAEGSPESRLMGGALPSRKEAARRASPVTHVTADDPPFLIAHGDRDPVVPVEQSRKLDARLREANVASDLRVLAGAGHGGRAFADADLRAAILAFFRRHLTDGQPVVTPPVPTTSAPAGPLARWARPGPREIGSLATTVLRDGARQKDLQVRVTWPRGEGPFPVVVWSHGARGTKDAYEPLRRHWASHGFVVVQADHADSRALGRKRDPDVFRHWADRVKDVTFLIDALPTLRERMEGFSGTLDTEAIGVGGHSFGAHTSQLIGGVTTRAPGEERHTSHADDRVAACLLVSPQGRGGLLDATSWKGFAKPALVVTGTRDTGRGGQPYTWRLEPFSYAPPGDKYLVLIEGARHGFGGIAGRIRFPGSGPDDASHLDAVRATSLLFWNAYLRGDATAKAVLASDRLAAASGGVLRSAHR